MSWTARDIKEAWKIISTAMDNVEGHDLKPHVGDYGFSLMVGSERLDRGWWIYVPYRPERGEPTVIADIGRTITDIRQAFGEVA